MVLHDKLIRLYALVITLFHVHKEHLYHACYTGQTCSQVFTYYCHFSLAKYMETEYHLLNL